MTFFLTAEQIKNFFSRFIMLYYSLNKNTPTVNFREATIQGQAPDKGLYFPEKFATLPAGWINDISDYTNEEIAYEVIAPYVGDTIPGPVLKEIISETIDFKFPLHPVTRKIFSLELFHGPTLAFKDVGARFMARCLGFFLRDGKHQTTVLVATSGDTGGAVADGFYDVEGIRVVILYPAGKISEIQELQITTHGKNIHAIAVDGTFDDCQKLVKQAFTDADLAKKITLTSANSINVARWLPQQFFYFFAWKYWADKKNPPVISVPSGNYGNICAGILSMLSGLPYKHFIAACNSNDVLTDYFKSGVYSPKPSVATISNAMDVGDPSNLKRVIELFGNNIGRFKKHVSSFCCTEEMTKEAISRVHREFNYVLDPHGAVGFLGLENYLNEHPGDQGIFLETAHPVKFPEVVEAVIQQKVLLPAGLDGIVGRKKMMIRMGVDYSAFSEYLLFLSK
ncbi:MAG: threonine synthase [Ginsengibacter sp.]